MPTTKEILESKKKKIRPENFHYDKKNGGKPKKEKPPKDFNMLKAIRNEPLHKNNVLRRDKQVRKYVDENLEIKGRPSVLPGQLVMFDYFEPATKEDLEYYDAMPCTIFFGIVNTEKGRRVLGFNIHYYPPRIRYQVIDRIFEIFRPLYLKAWNEPLTEEMNHFNYKMLIAQLQKAKLDFGIRMYIPKLMASVTPIPVKDWQKVVFTEGRFKKQTRDAILKYWKNKSEGITKEKKKK
jgi:hypothetical protein